MRQLKDSIKTFLGALIAAGMAWLFCVAQATAQAQGAPVSSLECQDADLMTLHQVMFAGFGKETDEAYFQHTAAAQGYADVIPMSRQGNRAYVLATSDRSRIVVAFRGTQNYRDVMTDFHFTPGPNVTGLARFLTNGRLHPGFRELSELYLGDIMREVGRLRGEAQSRGRNPKLVVTGHSLGGAVALLTGWNLSQRDLKPDRVVLFGSPRVGISFRPIYDRAQIDTIHYTIADDPVTRVPFGFEELPGRYQRLAARESWDGSNPFVALGRSSLQNLIGRGPGQAWPAFQTDALDAMSPHYATTYSGMLHKLCQEAVSPDQMRAVAAQAYLRMLGREASPAEKDFRAQQLFDRRWTRSELEVDLMASDEFRRHWVDLFYRQRLARPASEEEKNTWANYLRLAGKAPERYAWAREAIEAEPRFRTDYLRRVWEEANGTSAWPETVRGHVQDSYRDGLGTVEYRIRLTGKKVFEDWFVQLYRYYLGRHPTAAEESAGYAQALARGPEAYREITIALWASPECRERHISLSYREALGRGATAAEIERWSRELLRGMAPEDMRRRIFLGLGLGPTE